MDFLTLSEVHATQGKGPIGHRQVIVLENQISWKKEEAKMLLVNETTLALRKIILNAHNLYNPIKRWNDTIWYFRWIEDGKGESHCVIMVCIPLPSLELSLQKPDKYVWEHVHEVIGRLLRSSEEGELRYIKDAMALMMKLLLGNNLYDTEPSPPRPSFKRKKRTMINFEG
jgi:hypothetical protein